MISKKAIKISGSKWRPSKTVLYLISQFLLDVMVRRVAIDWDKLWARAKSVIGPGKPKPRTMDRLMQRKEAVRVARGEGLAKFQADPTVDHGPLEVAGSSTAPPGEGRPRPSAARGSTAEPPTPAVPGTGEDGYTNRLLAAKRRARKAISDSQASSDSDGDA